MELVMKKILTAACANYKNRRLDTKLHLAVSYPHELMQI